MASSRDPRRPDGAPEHPDPRLRRLLEPAPEAVERLVRRALAPAASPAAMPRPQRGLHWRPRPALAALATGLAALALLLAWRLDRLPFAPGPSPAPTPAAISIVNEGGILIVTSPAGDRLIRSAGPAPSAEPPLPGLILLSHGGTQE